MVDRLLTIYCVKLNTRKRILLPMQFEKKMLEALVVAVIETFLCVANQTCHNMLLTDVLVFVWL